MIQISKRLQAVAAMVQAQGPLADVGCDHGYIPIYLRQDGQIKEAIAMDINKGPLSKAKEHIAAYQMEAYIQTRLSDGVQALQQGEVTTVVIAGMGGGLVQKILQEGKQQLFGVEELILQPQSEIRQVRAALPDLGYQIVAEDIVLEDGKYYPMMRVIPMEMPLAKERAAMQEQMRHTWGKMLDAKKNEILPQVCLRYGPELLGQKHPVLQQFLDKEKKQYDAILQKIEKQIPSDKILQRRRELQEELLECEVARSILCMSGA